MGLHEILAQIDREISQLQRARAMLRETRKSSSSVIPKKRNLTPEGRRRIAEAVKRRWALQKKNQFVEAVGWLKEDSSIRNLAYQASRS